MEEIKSYLKAFNDKLAKLLNLTFSKKIEFLNLIYTQEGKSIYIFKDGQIQDLTNSNVFVEISLTPGVSHNGPSGEEFDSYILNLRFFIQNNDLLSIKNWIERINLAPLPSELIEEANILRNELNKLLDSPRLNVKLQENRLILTTRDIIEAYVYGEYAHSNPSKKKLFDEIGFQKSDNLCFILRTKEISEMFKKIYTLNETLINYSQSTT